MTKNAFYYFQSVYGKSDEPVVCIDQELNVIFATSAAYEAFGISKSPVLHLNCILMRKYLTTVKSAFEAGEFCSFTVESASDGSNKKCMFIPHVCKDEKAATLLFSDTEPSGIDAMTRYELKRAIQTTQSTIVTSTSIMVSHLRLIQNNINKENSVNIILKNVLTIRRLFKNLNIMATSHTKSNIPCYIELNSYIRFLAKVIEQQLGTSRISFSFNFCTSLLISEIEPKIFEILICNIVSNSVKSAFGKAKIAIQTATRGNFNLIVFSDGGIGCRNINTLFERAEENQSGVDDGFSGLGTSVIRKIVTNHGGRVYAVQNRDGGISVGFVLPKSENRQPVLRSPKEFSYDQDDIFSVVRVELADLLDIDNIKLQ